MSPSYLRVLDLLSCSRWFSVPRQCSESLVAAVASPFIPPTVTTGDVPPFTGVLVRRPDRFVLVDVLLWLRMNSALMGRHKPWCTVR